MKLITKIYLSIGLILLVFVFVTIIYFRQSNKVEKAVEQVLLSTEIIRTNGNTFRAILNAQTGLRGYLLSGKENFLEPYYQGVSDYQVEINTLKRISQNKPDNLEFIKDIQIHFKSWNDSIALPIVQAKQNAPTSLQAQELYDSLYGLSYDHQKGKARIDTIRHIINVLENGEIQNRNKLINKLNQSRQTTDLLGMILTALAVIIGIITAIFLGKTIQNRIISMKTLAANLARGNFDTEITDDYNDELSSLSSDMNLMAKKLQKSFQRLNKMNQELDQFAYVVSHDLKAPLRAINNLAEWIAEDIGETTPDIKQNLKLMRGRVHRLENLINGILEYARIGRKQIEKDTFDIGDLLAEIVESIAPPPRFTIALPTESIIISTEKILLQQVLTNLMSNAIKYNDKSAGIINIDVIKNQHQYWFKVQDNGPGIPAEFHDKIFGVFQTIEARDTIESTGIGLAIVKKIIEEKNGSIIVESAPGQGTAFIFTWPDAQPASKPENI